MSENKQYPSAEVLFDIVKSEYESEKVRTTTIDSKSGIVISLAAVFFVAITKAIDLKMILEMNVTSFSTVLLPAALFICIVGALVVSFVSLVFFLRVIFAHAYFCLKTEYFYDVKKLEKEKQLYSLAVSQFYIEATKANKSANDKRVKLYRNGMVLQIIAIGLFAIYMSLVSFM